MKEISLDHLLDVATRAAKTAGKHALVNKHRRMDATETFSHDVKLVLDVECQQIAEKVVASDFPNHGILGEEDTRQNDAEAYEWIIDPIDGTLNYAHGFPYWCCSIAVRYNQQVVAGCVYAPDFDQCFTAHAEESARLNGQPISISDTRDLKESLIFTGLSKHLKTSKEPHFEMFRMLALNTQKLRINGAAALDLCHVAAGTSDGFFETSLYLWDFAAGGLIAERAGAVLSRHPEPGVLHGYTVLCANEHLIGGLRDIHAKCS